MNPFPNLFRTCFLFGIILAFSTEVFAQCQSKLELLSTKKASQGQSNGRIQVKVSSPGEYSLILYSISGGGRQEVSTLQGSGEGKFKFEKLSGEHAYLVEVNFKNETEFLCKKKVLSDIFLTKEK